MWIYLPRVALGFLHRAGRNRQGGEPFSSSVYWNCRYVKGSKIRGWDRILPGGLWLHEPKPISNDPVGLGFPHREGRCRHRGPPFSLGLCWNCTYMEGFLIRGWDPITSSGAGSTNRSQSAINQWDWGLHTAQGGTNCGNYRFRPQFAGFGAEWKNIFAGDGTLSSRSGAGSWSFHGS